MIFDQFFNFQNIYYIILDLFLLNFLNILFFFNFKDCWLIQLKVTNLQVIDTAQSDIIKCVGTFLKVFDVEIIVARGTTSANAIWWTNR